MTQPRPGPVPETAREFCRRKFWDNLWFVVAFSPFLLPLCCCGGCGLWFLSEAPEVRRRTEQREAERAAQLAAEKARENAVRTAAIQSAKRALEDRGYARIADDVSAQQDYVESTRWRVTGQVLMGERIQNFTVVLQHARFNNADRWDVQSVEVGERAKPDPAGHGLDDLFGPPAEDPASHGLDDLFGPPAEKPAEDRPTGDAADAVAPARDLGASS